MSRKISINQLSPRLQRQVKQAVASLTKKSSVTLASKKTSIIDDYQDITNPARMKDHIRYFEKYFKSTESKNQFTKDVALIVATIKKYDAGMEPEVHAFRFTVQKDAKGNYECALEVDVRIEGDLIAFRDFQSDLAPSLSRLKICKYQKDEFLSVDVFDEAEDEEYDEDVVVTANGSLKFTIASDLVNVDLES